MKKFAIVLACTFVGFCGAMQNSEKKLRRCDSLPLIFALHKELKVEQVPHEVRITVPSSYQEGITKEYFDTKTKHLAERMFECYTKTINVSENFKERDNKLELKIEESLEETRKATRKNYVCGCVGFAFGVSLVTAIYSTIELIVRLSS